MMSKFKVIQPSIKVRVKIFNRKDNFSKLCFIENYDK